MSEPDVPLINDDDIEGVGFHALYDVLSELADVTAIASTTDQNVVGRKMSTDAIVAEHELGYALEGTFVDCTVAGLEALCPDVDVVVSGINKGANIGAYIPGRSGIVSVAAEAMLFDVPITAFPLYIPVDGDLPWYEKTTGPRDFHETTNTASHFVKYVEPADVFEQRDYLNVNVPVSSPDGGLAGMQVTVPSELYGMTVKLEDGTMKLHDRVWERMETDDIPGPDGTDHRAVVEGHVSVSSLTAPHMTHWHKALDALIETYLE